MAQVLRPNKLGKDREREEELLSRYNPRLELTLSEAALIMDEHRTVLVWYLPGALSEMLQEDMWNCLDHIRGLLWQSLGEYAGCQSWQMQDSHFWDDVELKGCINLSLAWFQQGCNVGTCALPGDVSDDKQQGTGQEPSTGSIGVAEEVQWRLWRQGIGGCDGGSKCPAVCNIGSHAPRPVCSRARSDDKPWDYTERVDAEMGEVLERWLSVYGVISVMVN
ncbi:hypothetical protein PAXRUDRAFT_156404 [Paxillus rubicundulus Ve08.2h10]|uniref:Unplaced genomic scaffold scaffold_1003, whole genome shotgun sequence n=1 Tax=Paxillus rubicundulus Ve08.2h10 TaxID=930991 RepID=A0A0D0DB57_9AGAM|nr:hypothetical protein PAXRUDRAFT_156404 [Paxillus rubicundulus Ve08.2h10]